MALADGWELSPTRKVVAEIAPKFVPFIKELFFNNIGFGVDRVSVCDVKSSYKPQSFDENEEPRGDRFRILFPFANRFVKWEIIFDWYHPDRAPDFLFSDDFMQKLDKLMLDDMDFLASWANWDHNDPKSLLYVLRSLLEHYNEYQISLLEEDSRVKTELKLLLSTAGLAPSALEVLSGPSDSVRKTRPTDKTAVSFLVRLPIDFSEHQATDTSGSSEGDDGDCRVMLSANFYNANDSRPTLDLHFSPGATKLLDAATLPMSTGLRGTPLHAAIAKATERVREVLAQIGNAKRQRAELLTTLARKLHPGLVELDTKHFLSATFLIGREDFLVLLSVRLDQDSPGRKPEVHLRSTYSMGADGQPLSKAMEDFPYSNSWRAEDKADRILRFCFEGIVDFMAECMHSAETDMAMLDLSD